jgi:hypothetical protein
MEGIDFIPDFLSDGFIGLLALERVWSKIKAWLEEKALDKRLDKMGERIANLEGKTSK